MKTIERRNVTWLNAAVTRQGMVLALALTCASAQADERFWTGALSNFWGNGNNWDTTGPGPSDTAVFTDAAANHSISLLGGVTTINALLFDSTSPYLITDGSLSLGDLTANAGFVTHDLLVNVDIAQDSIWTINSDATVVVSGQFTADGGVFDNGVIKAGAGTLMLAGNNNNVATNLLITDGVVRLIGGSAYSDTDRLRMEGGSLLIDGNETIGGLRSIGLTVPAVELDANALILNVPSTVGVRFGGSITGGATSKIEKTGGGTQTLDGSASVGGFEGLDGVFKIDGGTFTMPDDGVQTFTVSGADARVEVRNGGLLQLPSTASGGVFGGLCRINDGGELLITGAGSSVLASRVDALGTTSPGTVTVASGALLDVRQGSDPWMFIAANGVESAQGALEIKSGGEVVTDSVVAGVVANNTGSITVQHSGSTLEADTMYLGGYAASQFGGTGSLSITDGGSVTLGDRLDVFTDACSISVDGGVLSTPTITTFNGATPFFEISDPPGAIALQLGGELSSSSTTINYEIADAFSGPGSIEKTGLGRLTVAHGCTYSGGLTVTDGSLRLQDAARQFASLTGSGPVDFDGLELDGTGVIAGALSVGGTSVVRPSAENGSGVGSIECGSLALGSQSTLEINIGPGSFSQIYVDGAAQLNGTLDLNYTGGFTASPGNWFEVVAAGEVTGALDTIIWPDGQNWAAYEAGGSLWVGICDTASECMADCLDEVQVYGPRIPAESVIGNGTIVALNRGAAGIEIVDASGPMIGPALATIPVNVNIAQNSKGMALNDSVLAIAGGAPRLYDVTDPSNPIFQWSTNWDAYDVAIQGDLLAVAHATGLVLYDIANPAAPLPMGGLPAPLPYGFSGTVTFHDGLLFWSWQSDDFFTGEVVILDVSNPVSPVELGAIAANFFVCEPQFKNDIMLLSNDNGVRAIDISDVTSPTQVAWIPLPGIDQESALMGGRLFRVSSAGLTVLDVSDPASPVEIDNLVGFASDDGVTSIDGKLYVVASSGLSVIDVCDQVDPCPADVDDDGAVGITDLLALLAAWGTCSECPADIDGNGVVDTVDLLAILAAWGPCP